MQSVFHKSMKSVQTSKGEMKADVRTMRGKEEKERKL